MKTGRDKEWPHAKAHQRSWTRQERPFFSSLLEGVQCCLNVTLLVSRTVMINISVIPSHLVYGQLLHKKHLTPSRPQVYMSAQHTSVSLA